MRIRGAIEQKTSQVITGWLAITAADDAPIMIDVLYQGRTIGGALAYEARPDVRDAGYGDGNCGFTFHVPPLFQHIAPEEFELRLAGTELYLAGPRGLEIEQTPPAYGEGSVFILGPARSGTSVMFLALQSVMGLSGLGESHVPQIFQRLAYQFYEYVRDFSNRDGILAQRLQVREFREHLLTYLRQFYFEQFGNAPFVDKTPGLEALVGAPFIREAFPGARIIVMERNGIETINSYRKKFNASFDEALTEWSSCAQQIAQLKTTMPDILFVSQNMLRSDPNTVALKIAAYLEKDSESENLTKYFRESRQDILSDTKAWDRLLTLHNTDWSDEEKIQYSNTFRALGRSNTG